LRYNSTLIALGTKATRPLPQLLSDSAPDGQINQTTDAVGLIHFDVIAAGLDQTNDRFACHGLNGTAESRKHRLKPYKLRLCLLGVLQENLLQSVMLRRSDQLREEFEHRFLSVVHVLQEMENKVFERFHDRLRGWAGQKICLASVWRVWLLVGSTTSSPFPQGVNFMSLVMV
jgi:hypothetical protein